MKEPINPSLRPVFDEHRVVSADGTSLYYRSCGEGPSLLLCDGLFCDGHVWKYLIPYLCSFRRILHWHYPGHGLSETPSKTADFSPRRLGDDAAAIITHAKAERVVVVGHSLGVQVALETAWRHPSLVAGLVLICGSPGRVVETFHESAVLNYFLPFLSLTERFLPEQAKQIWRRLPTHWLVALTKWTGEINPRLLKMEDLAPYLIGINDVEIHVAIRMIEAAGHHDASPYLENILKPVLVIGGKKDRFTPSTQSTYMANKLPNAQLLLSKEGTHSLPLEQPDLVNLRIKTFLTDKQI